MGDRDNRARTPDRVPVSASTGRQGGRHVGVSPAWIGGQGIEPYEQNTQQSAGLGRRSSPQPVQS